MIRGLLLIIFMGTALVRGMAQTYQPTIPAIINELKKVHADSAQARLLLDLALDYVRKPGEYNTDLDTAIVLVKQVESINQKLQDKKTAARCYFVYSNALREGGKAEVGKQYIEKSLEVYKTISDPAGMAEAWVELGNYYSIYVSEEETRQKRKPIGEALILFRATGNKERQADILKDLGDLDQLLGDPVLAMKELNEAVNIYRSVGHKELQGIYGLMGNVCGKQGDLPDAVKFGLLAVKTAEEVNDTTLQLGTIYFRLGLAYGYWSKWEQALPYSKQAMSIAIKYKDRWSILANMEIICRLLSALGREAESLESIHQAESLFGKPWSLNDSIVFNLCYVLTYVEAQQYDKAKAYVHQLENLLKRPGAIAGYNTYQYRVKYYLGTRQYENAAGIMSEYLPELISKHEKRVLAQAYKLNAQLDSARGKFGSALVNYQLYKSITDSMLNEATTFQFAQMEVEHETEKKDNDIKILQQQEIIQEANLKQSRLVNNIVIVGVVVLGLLLALLYNRYRTNQRHNRQLETKQEEINEKNTALEHLITDKDNLIADKDVLLKEKEWLVKEIHHRVKNNLQLIISLLNAQFEFLHHPSAISAIRESRERMQAIAILHQKLYQQENTGRINMRSYINELVENIRDSIAHTERISFELCVADIYLDISQSVPLGLILNEAITNTIKYAYPKNKKGSIRISLQYTGTQKLQLKIADHGKGLPDGMDTCQSDSLGLQLIRLFSEQLDGDLYFINENGLEINLTFRAADYNVITTNRINA